MKVFRIENEEGQPSHIKQLVFGIIILSILVSFVWQMSLGYYPVP